MTDPGGTSEQKAAYSTVGRSMPQLDTAAKATGMAKFTADLKFPGKHPILSAFKVIKIMGVVYASFS